MRCTNADHRYPSSSMLYSIMLFHIVVHYSTLYYIYVLHDNDTLFYIILHGVALSHVVLYILHHIASRCTA
jgi:hypothetical protein